MKTLEIKEKINHFDFTVSTVRDVSSSFRLLPVQNLAALGLSPQPAPTMTVNKSMVYTVEIPPGILPYRSDAYGFTTIGSLHGKAQIDLLSSVHIGFGC